ncbi:MAG: hypothetical protein AB7W59_00395 [Acidimicrobiia bacterium]
MEVLEFIANTNDGALSIEDAAEWELDPSALRALLACGLVEELVEGVATLAPAWFRSEAPNALWFVRAGSEVRPAESLDLALASASEGSLVGFWDAAAWGRAEPALDEICWLWRMEGARRVPTFQS